MTQPQSQTVTQWNNVTFSVTATGTMPLYYRWQFNSANTSGTSSSYTLNNVQLNQAGDYRCVVSNAVGVATSAVATLTVLAPPAITMQPQSLINATGTIATFTVVATGSAPLSYRWRKDDVILGDGGKVSGATSGTLTVAGVADTNAGNYQVVVTNTLGSVTSVVARLTVVSVPPPPILGIGVTGTTASISFTAVAGLTYTLEYKDSLGSTTWTTIPPPVVGNGGVMTKADTNATVRRRFYRVWVE
jgi:hypothetical protein